MPFYIGSDLQFVPSWFWAVFVFVLGLCIGSFLNVVIYRIPREKSVVWPGSHCPSCDSAISFYDNIPILSYAILRGKCRSCSAFISLIYPSIELLTGLVFLAAFYRFGFKLELIFNLIFLTALISLIFIDYFDQILPDIITKPGLAIALLLRCFVFNLIGMDFIRDIFQHFFGISLLHLDKSASIMNSMLGMMIGGGTLWLIGIGYFRLRSFRLNTAEELGSFLREECVPGTLVRLRIRRGSRSKTIYIEGGDFSEIPPEELSEKDIDQLSELGDPRLKSTCLVGVNVAEDDNSSTAGIVITEIVKDSFAAEYGLKPNDIIIRANREGMGLGDVKMMFFVGAFLGAELTFLTLFLASIIGGVIAIYKIITEGSSALRTALPFGVMLGIGAIFSLFYGEYIIEKYFEFFNGVY